MTDQTAFENLIAEDVRDEVGPEEAIDALAIARKARADSTRWRFQPMYSALKFVAAGAIAALCGSLLLAGVLTAPQGDEMAPAAVTESPSPVTTEELLSSMVTEEVEPGVLRVTEDGTQQLGPGEIDRLVVGLDGSVWVAATSGLRRLGDEQPTALRPGAEAPPYDDFAVGPDGTLWLDGTHWDADPWDGLAAWDGEGWTRLRPEGLPADHRPWGLRVARDGSVWVLLAGRGLWQSGTALLAQLHDERWEVTDFPSGALPELFGGGSSGVWAVEDDMSARSAKLYRFDGSRWQQKDTPDGLANGFQVVVGADDTLWTRLRHGQEEAGSTDSPAMSMAHFDGAEWRLWDQSDFPTVSDDNLLWALEPMGAGSDGSLWGQLRWGSWISPFSPDASEPVCDGAVRFDGAAVTRYLKGRCVGSLDVADDGYVWLLAGPDDDTYDLFVITPEAVAGTES